MTNEISNLILEHLKAIRASQDLMKSDLTDIKARLLAVENYQALMHADIVRLTSRIAELDLRLERIERRLELREEA